MKQVSLVKMMLLRMVLMVLRLAILVLRVCSHFHWEGFNLDSLDFIKVILLRVNSSCCAEKAAILPVICDQLVWSLQGCDSFIAAFFFPSHLLYRIYYVLSSI